MAMLRSLLEDDILEDNHLRSHALQVKLVHLLF